MIKKFFLFFLCFASITQANIHSSLILKRQPKDWSFEGEKIRKKSNDSFENCKKDWQHIVEQLWGKIIIEICSELGISEEAFTNMIHEEAIQKLYFQLKEPLKEKTKKNRVISYIKHTLRQHTSHRCNIFLRENKSFLTKTFGIEKSHTVFCSPNFFNEEQINYIYGPYPKKSFFYYPRIRSDYFSCIEIKTFSSLILAITASYMNHYKDFYAIVINDFEINKKSVSDETKLKFEHFCECRSALEGVLQSSNPLEAALLMRSIVTPKGPFEAQEIALWTLLIEDLKECYHAEDLKSFYATFNTNLLYFKKQKE